MVIHEVIHRPLRLNGIELSEEEEELTDSLRPEGYLLRKLGLSTAVRIPRSRSASTVSRYFENRLINVISLIEYLGLNGLLRPICRERHNQ